MKQYLLTEPIFKRLIKKYGSLRCHYCGDLIKPKEIVWKIKFNGSNVLTTIRVIKNHQVVVSIPYGHNGKVKHYHSEYYEKLFID